MKFIDYTSDNKTTVVTIEYKGKQYQGISNCHPDDTYSKFAGGEIAEMRALIKAFKEEYLTARHDCDEMRKLVKICTQYKNFDKESPTAKVMYRELNHQIKKVNKLADRINSLYVRIDNRIKGQEKFKSYIENKSKEVNQN